jgi:hypothetical protein
MTGAELDGFIMDELGRIKSLFNRKNAGYGDDIDGLYNFRETARRHMNSESPEAMYRVLAILRDKHDATIAKNGLNDPDFVERMRDSVVYGLLALAIHAEKERREEKEL